LPGIENLFDAHLSPDVVASEGMWKGLYFVWSLDIKAFSTTPGYVCFYKLLTVDKLSAAPADFLRVFADTMEGEKKRLGQNILACSIT
jgi:hypothetical protein